MLFQMAQEKRQTMFGSSKVTDRLRDMCLSANISEVDLTSDEKSSWKQLFLCIPLEQAKKIIGDGITHFTFHLLSDILWFEISCLEGTKWLVNHYEVPKRMAKADEAYTWREFLEHYGETKEDTKIVCFMREGQHEIQTYTTNKLHNMVT